jgi:hypothetical protein
VDGICAGLGDDIDDTSGITASFGGGLGLLGILLDGIKGKDDAGDAEDATLVDGGDVVPEVVVIDAVDLPVDLVGAGAIDGATAVDGVASEAGGDGDELGKVAAVHGRVVDDGRGDVGGLGDGGGVEGDVRGLDLNDGGGR